MNCYDIDSIAAEDFRTAETCDCQSLSQASGVCRRRLRLSSE